MKLIPLTKGQFAKVSDEDYEFLLQWKWRAFWDWHSKSYYARASETGKSHKTRRELRMHRLVLGLEYGDKRHGDHIDHDTLNNQRTNLRIATVSENNQHRRTPKNNTSGAKGLIFHRKTERWEVRLQVNKVRKNYGIFDSRDAAISRRNEVVEQIHGGFATYAL